MKKLPIGLSDFKELIQEKYYYIDKTNLISEIIDNSAKIVLLPRPRRFGKTLNLSMTKYFFDVEEDNREIFDNLNISKNQEAMAHCGKYPIIYITFKDVKESSFERSIEKIDSIFFSCLEISLSTSCLICSKVNSKLFSLTSLNVI